MERLAKATGLLIWTSALFYMLTGFSSAQDEVKQTISNTGAYFMSVGKK